MLKRDFTKKVGISCRHKIVSHYAMAWQRLTIAAIDLKYG